MGIDIVHLTTPADFIKWRDSVAKSRKSVLYLFDHELLGQELTGLDLIEKYQLANAVLVTSYSADEEVKKRCVAIKVKILPKTTVGVLPIEGDVQFNDNKEIYDMVLIEDDDCLCLGWERMAKRCNVSLLAVSTYKEFIKNKRNISREKTKIYLDNNLGENELTGEEIAYILHQEGYRNLFLATGLSRTELGQLPDWLEVVGKNFPNLESL